MDDAHAGAYAGYQNGEQHELTGQMLHCRKRHSADLDAADKLVHEDGDIRDLFVDFSKSS